MQSLSGNWGFSSLKKGRINCPNSSTIIGTGTRARIRAGTGTRDSIRGRFGIGSAGDRFKPIKGTVIGSFKALRHQDDSEYDKVDVNNVYLMLFTVTEGFVDKGVGKMKLGVGRSSKIKRFQGQ